jgi:CheY-like chemotaxis protein
LGNAVAGAGLGLTISKILAGIMGGELTVASEVGKGSHFTVRLYLPHQRNRETPTVEEDIVGYAGNRRKILIVDDHAEQRTLLHSVLAPLGFDIEEAASGEECLGRVRQIRHDLLLLDIAMSGMSGIEVAGQLRATGYGQPILMVSANAYAVDRNRASEAGCDDFLAKPIQISALLARIKLHLGLSWIYRGEAKPTPADVHRVLPPPEVLNELRAAVRMGDLRTLNDRLLALVDLDLAYLPFARNLQTLAREFRLADLRKALGDF